MERSFSSWMGYDACEPSGVSLANPLSVEAVEEEPPRSTTGGAGLVAGAGSSLERSTKDSATAAPSNTTPATITRVLDFISTHVATWCRYANGTPRFSQARHCNLECALLTRRKSYSIRQRID